MSLTTAISDDDEVESNPAEYKMASALRPASVSASTAAAAAAASSASFNCTGAVRKAGFLSVKKWLLRKKHQVSGK